MVGMVGAMVSNQRWWLDMTLLAISLLALVGGAALYWSSFPALAHGCWTASALLMAAVLLVEGAMRLWRRELGVDLIALLAIIGALALDQSLVAADGDVLDQPAVLDESSLTGESLPVKHAPGSAIQSGSVNAGTPFDMRASHPAAQSTYAGIVRLVEEAQRSRAPLTRMADRFALFFIPLTLAIAAAAWVFSGDAVRALAVLVVATPCPLILAAPMAMVGGLSRCARRGILVKGGAVLEALARARVLFFDKTGTLTTGEMHLLAIETDGRMDENELLRLAASLAQASTHVASQNIVRVAHERGLALNPPGNVVEEPGAGLRGEVDGHQVALGSHAYAARDAAPVAWVQAFLRNMDYGDATGSFVVIDGAMAGALSFADRLRQDAPRAVRKLRQAGIRRIMILTGDRLEPAQAVGTAVGADEVHARLHPPDKLALIEQTALKTPTIMVGDGINDAPALAAAGVGIAIGARGATAASDTADVVLLTDRLDRVAEALHIAHRTRGIAMQSIVVGMGLSLLAMLAAAMGHLPPLAGRLHELDDDTALSELAALIAQLQHELLPHEHSDEAELYPELAEKLGGDDPLAALSQSHREIFRLVRLLERMTADRADNGASAAPALHEIHGVLHRLDVVLDLHFTQEEELFRNFDAVT